MITTPLLSRKRLGFAEPGFCWVSGQKCCEKHQAAISASVVLEIARIPSLYSRKICTNENHCTSWWSRALLPISDSSAIFCLQDFKVPYFPILVSVLHLQFAASHISIRRSKDICLNASPSLFKTFNPVQLLKWNQTIHLQPFQFATLT